MDELILKYKKEIEKLDSESKDKWNLLKNTCGGTPSPHDTVSIGVMVKIHVNRNKIVLLEKITKDLEDLV